MTWLISLCSIVDIANLMEVSTMLKHRDLTGQKFGLLTVIRRAGLSKSRSALWFCKCDCGGEKVMGAVELRRNLKPSCGCTHRALLLKAKTVVGHGMSRHPLYGIWHNMFQRCYDPNSRYYYNYGKRGIKVCERWHDPRNFIADMGDRPTNKHSLERRDNDGHYEPDNCFWATSKQQGRNKRNNRRIEFRGKSKTLSEWAEETGINEGAIRNRIDTLNWTIEKALTTPIDPDYRRRGLAAHN